MNIIKRLGIACAATVSLAALGGCVDDYGYGGVGVGYGPAAPGYDTYYDGYYGDGPYGAYAPGYYGWYGGYYYPGSGIYVYDRYRRPIRWNGDQRRYWGDQRRGYANGAGRGFRPNANWGGFNRGAGGGNRPGGQAFRGAGGGGFHGGGYRGGGGGGRHR